MATLQFNKSENNAASLAKAKAAEFNQGNRRSNVGHKTEYNNVPAFYLGSAIKEHFPYKRDADGNKIEKKDSKAKFTEYEKEDTSDGWQFALRTPGRETLYVVTKAKPELELGSFFLISGLGYGSGQYPTFLDEAIKLELAGKLVYLDNDEVVIDEQGEE